MWVVLLRFQWWSVRISFERMVHNSIRIQFVHTNFVTRYKIAVSPFSSPLVNPRHSLRDFVYHDGQNVPSRTSLLLLCSLEGRSLHALLLIFQVFSEMSWIIFFVVYKAYISCFFSHWHFSVMTCPLNKIAPTKHLDYCRLLEKHQTDKARFGMNHASQILQ